MTQPLRVALVGAGDISRYHLAAWHRVRDADVVAVCDRIEPRAAARAAQFEIPAVYTDAAAMLERERPDAVDIATVRETHVQLTLLAADFGAHVLCQKPLAPTLAEAQALVDDLGGRVRLMVHENRRFAPHFRRIREWIEAGKVGSVRQVVMTTHRSSLLKGADGRRPSVERASYYGYEPRLLIGEALIHQLDVLRFLLGPLRVLAARALRTDPELPGETVATVLLETVRDAAPIALAGSYVSPGFAGSGSAPGALGAQTSDRLEIIGAQSSVVMTDDRIELRGAFSERLDVDYAAVYQLCFDRAIAHFADALRSGQPFETSAEDNLHTLRLVEDAYELAGTESRPDPHAPLPPH